MVCIRDLKQQAEKLGVKIEEYPDRVIAKYGNIVVEGKIINNTIEVTIQGLPAPIKGVLKPERGYVQQTVYLGPTPIASVGYKIAESDFLGTIKCFLTAFVIITIVVFALTAVGLELLNPLFILIAVFALLIGPIIAALICL